MAKAEKIDLNNMENSHDFNAVANAYVKESANSLPKGAVLFDKGLLPSRGKLYSETIYVKKLSTANIQSLSTIDENNANYIFNTILTSCVFGIDTNKICVGDKLWFIYYLRAFTFDDAPYKLKHTCKNCEQASLLDYRLKNLKVDYLDKDVPPYFELKNGDKVTIKFPTIGDEFKVNQVKNDPNLIESYNESMLNFALNIAEVNGKKMPLLNAYEYVSNMDACDFSYLVNSFTEYMFTVRPFAEFQCPKCGETVYERIPFTPMFFLPKEV